MAAAKGKGKKPCPSGGKAAKRGASPKSHKRVKDAKIQKKKEESSSEELSEKEVQVDFEFFNMAEPDYHSVRQFLMVAFGASGHPLPLSDMAAFITEQAADHVGTTAKTEGESSDPVAFCTCLPVKFAEKEPFSSKLVSFVRGLVPDAAGATRELLEGALMDGCAIVLNERFINLPAGIAEPMLDNLLSDWRQAMSEEPLFKVRYVLYLTPTYRLVKSALDRDSGDEDTTVGSSDPATNYHYQEAELLEDLALGSIPFKPVTSHSTTDSRRAFSEEGVDAGRVIFLLDFAGFETFVHLIGKVLID